MKLKKTFAMGGISPEKYKISTDIAIAEAGLPEYVYIPVKQHIGAPAKFLVAKGDKVKVGTLLADSDGILSSDVHSSVSGEVLKVEEVEGGIGYLENMITIKVEGDVWEESIDRSPDVIREIPFTAEEIVKKIQDGGIVGMGGAGFPTPIKTSIPEGRKVDYLILNGIECEPFLTADDRLMVERAEEIIMGAKVLNKVLGIQNAIIAIDENKPKAIEIMHNLTRRYVGVNVAVLKTKYPQGAEKQLVKAVSGREIPSGKLPADVGCIVQNVGTVFAIYEMVLKNKPLFERIVTISGTQADIIANLRVRVGTPILFILNQCSQNPKEIGKIILGGPMMGTAVTNFNGPVTKLTSGILLFDEKLAYKPVETTCIRCAKCVDACPMGLRPYLIADLVKEALYKEAKPLSCMDCIECGACAYVCPAKIPLLDYLKLAKGELRK